MRRIIVDKNPETGITRTALLQDARLVEILFAGAENAVAGNIYAGLVETILPSRFAFIDIGLEKSAFLDLDDKREAGLYRDGALQIKPGQTVLVQALKDPAGEKGAYVTSHLGFRGRFGVLSKILGQHPQIGVSRKIESAEERKRLQKIAKAHLPDNAEIVIRTNAQGCAEDEFAAELAQLGALYQKAENEWRHIKAPALVHSVGAAAAEVSELFGKSVDEILVEGDELHAEIAEAAAFFFAGAEQRVRQYDEDIALFRAYGIDAQIEKALHKKVWLKSGGFLVIEQTEACAVIDVNTGKFAGKKNHEQSVLQVNLEAAAEIARQIRLRNLGGIIIVDFIDMKDAKNANKLIDALTEAVKPDRMATNVVGMTELGLMQMTRKKSRKPLAAEIYGGDKS